MKHPLGAICLALLLGIAMSPPANASSILGGKVIAVYAYGDKALVDITGTRTTQPACAVSTQYAFDLTTPAGRAKYATALTAFTNQRNVQITGANTCTDWGDHETVNEIGQFNDHVSKASPPDPDYNGFIPRGPVAVSVIL